MRYRALLAISALLLLVGIPSAASAHKIVGHDGMIHACYKVKGKPKGALRAVHGRAKCRRGERKVAWRVTGAAAQNGTAGPTGAAAPDSALAALTERVNALTARVEKLEGIVGAVCSQVSLVTSLLPLPTFSCASL